MLTLDQFKEARSVLQGVISKTNLVYSKYFSELCGNQVYMKPENLQVTGAYKIRGAYYKTTKLTEEQKAHGLITASAGNHAQGVAYAAQVAGVKATVVMPTTTPLMKVNQHQGVRRGGHPPRLGVRRRGGARHAFGGGAGHDLHPALQ